MEWTDYGMELGDHFWDQGLVNKTFGYMIASRLFDKYSFLEEETINPDICKDADLPRMANLLDEEAEK